MAPTSAESPPATFLEPALVGFASTLLEDAGLVAVGVEASVATAPTTDVTADNAVDLAFFTVSWTVDAVS